MLQYLLTGRAIRVQPARMPAPIPTRLAASAAVALLLLPALLPALPQNILVLGDSLSEEYAFELPFSAPDSAPLAANIRNWVEMLASTRANEVSFGSYSGHLAAYGDYRNGGHSFNWAVPGFRATDLAELIAPPALPRTPEQLLDSVSCTRLKSQLKNDVGWVVVFCSGNDLSSLYSELCTGAAPPAQLDAIRDNLAATIDFIRSQKASLKIVLVNAPDIGVTPSVKYRAPDPALRAVATAGIASLNARLAALATDRGVALAEVFALTRQLDSPAPFLLNGTAFTNTGDPTRENRPAYLFAKDGFHASTAAQALLANAILQAMNTRYAAGFTLLPNREILSAALGLSPEQPFIDWLAAAGLPSYSATSDDPDHDGIPLLAEFALGLSSDRPDSAPWAASPQAGAALCFTFPSDYSGGYARVVPEWNSDLGATWHEVPDTWMTTTASTRTVTVPASVGPRAFVRLHIGLAP